VLTPLEPLAQRLLFSFSKDQAAAYLPHLAIVEALSRAFQIVGLPMQLSEGFNPMPRLELVQPLPLGVPARAEIASILLKSSPGEGLVSPDGSLDPFIEAMNRVLPSGMGLHDARLFSLPIGRKIHSLNGLAWGSLYAIRTKKGKAVLDIEALASSLEARIQGLGIPKAEIRLQQDGSLELLLPDLGRKEAGLMRMLETFVETRPVQSAFEIERLACLATLDKGETFLDYDKAFAAIDLS
jgi:radical SAM-linked protein